jgi:16S rRNA (guanine527-N7)-methyltransferase
VPDAGPREHSPAAVERILSEARQAGFLGPGPLEPQIRHAEGFARQARRQAALGPPPPRIVDLGSGGGLPGLVIAVAWPEAQVVLLDANSRRTDFLTLAVTELGLDDRVSVVRGRAEVIGRDPAHRACYDGVVARSFGRPATLAECAAPLLLEGGWLIVSEPPDGPEHPHAPGAPDAEDGGHPNRWPSEPLQELGLVRRESVQEEFAYQVLRQASLCPDRFPRRDGVPGKRPLF